MNIRLLNNYRRYTKGSLRLGMGLVISLALVILALACAGPSASAGEPKNQPITYAEETSTATPEADAPTPEPPLLTYAPAPEAEEHEAQAMPVSPFQPEAAAPPSAAEDACPDRELDPLPRSGVAGSQDFWRSFREPLPPAPVWNPPGPKRVGIQAGHWRTDDVPTELARLAGGGTSGGGYAEWEVNLDLAQRTAAILERYGVQVDILPATVPPSYRAHAFVSIHADGDLSGALHGFKVARSGFSPIPETDDVLVDKLYAEYENATGLSRDDIHVSLRMRYYYAFNSRRYCHAITPGVPAAIVEAGFLTNAADRQLLLGNPDAAAEGIARGVLSFLGLLEQQGR